MRSPTTLRGAVRQLISVCDREAKHLVFGAFVLMLGASMLASLSPLLLKLLIDAVEHDGAGAVGITPPFLVLIYALAHWLSRSLGELRGMFHGRADQRIQIQLSKKLFQHVMSLPLRFHLDRKTGAINQTLTNGLMGFRIVQHHLINSILPVLIELATMGTVLVFLGHAAFLVLIGGSVVSYAVAFWIGAIRVRAPARDASTAHIDAGAVFTDSLLNYETVKFFNAESQVRSRLVVALKRTEDRWSEVYTRKMINGLAIATIFTLSLGVSVYVAARGVLHGTMSIGDFVLVNAYLIQLTRPLETIGFAFRDIMQSVAFIEKMTELLRATPELDSSAAPALTSMRRGELVFDNVSFSYDERRYVLKNVNFVVPPGRTLGIVGASGSGKSSLIRLLLRMLDPTKGQIRFGGSPLENCPISSLRDAISVVPQDIALFNESVAYNIALGRKGSTTEEIVAAAKVADVHEFIVGLPRGYDTEVGERGVKISGGEKQRLAIARAAIKAPELFVFDEATSSLDSRTERAILGNLVQAAANTTAVIIAHRLSTVVHADEIIVLEDGRIVERGTHGDLIRLCGLYTTMWHAQHEIGRTLPCNRATGIPAL